jgi:hypothetical protein
MSKKIYRYRCPCCGMMPTIESIEKTKERPAEVRIILQELGGKVPGKENAEGPYYKKGRGSAAGVMSYTDVTGEEQQKLLEVQTFVLQRIQEYVK